MPLVIIVSHFNAFGRESPIFIVQPFNVFGGWTPIFIVSHFNAFGRETPKHFTVISMHSIPYFYYHIMLNHFKCQYVIIS